MQAISKAIIAHTLDHARAALAAAEQIGAEITLLTPPGGHAAAGAPYYRRAFLLASADHPSARFRIVLDVGTDGAMGLDALAKGWRHLLFTGGATARAKLASAARQVGGEVLSRQPPALNLDGAPSPDETCMIWLKKE